LSLLVYYILVFFSALFYEDLSNIELIKIGGLTIYIADAITAMILFSFIRFLQLKTKPGAAVFKVTCVFLGWIAVAVIIGFPRYGFRAIGEVRTMSNYFAFFVPFVLVYPDAEIKTSAILDVLRNTLFIAAFATLIIFIIELMIGGRFFISSKMNEVAGGLEDFRGIRILNSDHAFHLTAILMLIVLSYALKYRRDAELIVAGSILLVIVLYSKNRTSPVALFAAFGIWIALKGYFRLLLSMLSVALILSAIIYLINPAFAANIAAAFGGIFNVSEDGTGQFRLLVQAVAIQQGLMHPIMGEGFGNYFNYYIPQLGITYDVPPHSMFVYLFQKTGIVGTALAFITIISFSYSINKKMKEFSSVLSSREMVYLNVLFILILSQLFYGLAYNFSMFFGLYAGFAVMLLEKMNSKNGNSQTTG
jgi:O-antigen ligase